MYGYVCMCVHVLWFTVCCSVLSSEPPSVVTQSAVSVSEGEGVVLKCMLEGRSDAVLWRRCGQVPLPPNVTQLGTDLVISPVTRQHSGCYECTALNGDTSSTNTTIVSVLCKSGCVWWVCLVGVYGGYVWWVCVVGVYGGYVWYSHC